MSVPPELPALPASTEPAPPPTPHPIDVALGALGEVAAALLVGSRPSRFAEIQNVMAVAQAVQRLRPAELASVDDMGVPDDGMEMGGFNVAVGPGVMANNPVRVMRGARWNDGVDLNTQMLMMAQNFLKEYTAIEKTKAAKPDPDVRLNEVSELAELYGLRLKLATETPPIPEEITRRINQLLKRIGETSTEPVLHACPVDAPCDPKGDR